jgi:predicted ATPase
MLVAISGSQGSGKSTIIQEIEKRGYKVVNRKTSRSILTDWGVTLQQVNNDHELTKKFQDEIIKRKQEDEEFERAHAEMHGPDPVFTERTYADLFTYALISLGKDNEHSEWMDHYYNECMKRQQSYGLVFYLPAGMFSVVHDGVRGSNQHYSTMVDVTMREFTEQMTHPSRLNLIRTPDLQQRVSIIIEQALSFTSF